MSSKPQPTKLSIAARQAFALGLEHQEQGRLAEAVAAYGRALALAPEHAKANSNLGAALFRLGRMDGALAAFRRAIAIEPDMAAAHNNLGAALKRLGHLGEAESAYRRAIALQPDFAEAYSNLGEALRLNGELDEAIPAYRRAIEIEPDLAAARHNLGMALLTQGKLAEGWAEYEWRRKVRSHFTAQRRFPQPSWPGTALERKALLLWGEQGVGDAILYAGMIPDVLERAPRCVLECQPRLRPLFSRSFPSIEVLAFGNPPDPRTAAPDIAYQTPLGSLPRWFRNRFEDFPARPAYLTADRQRIQALRARYRALGPGPLIGIAWRSRNRQVGSARSVPLADWAPILAAPGVTFINLQYGDCAAELASIGDTQGIAVHHDAVVDQLEDLDAFAAQIAALDMVIAIDNSTVHMAGALGRRAWVMLPEGTGLFWCWFLDREDSPWYPSLRLFRQPSPGAWEPVIERVAGELARWANARATAGRGLAAS